MKNIVKTVLIGYCTYKAIDALVEKTRDKKEEEYVSFDEIEIKEEPKQDTTKNAAMFIGGIALGLAIKPTKKIVKETHTLYFLK